MLQDAPLISGTIRDNLRYGRLDATDAELERASARGWMESRASEPAM